MNFFIEVSLLFGSYLDIILLHQIYDGVRFLFETIANQLKKIDVCVFVNGEAVPCFLLLLSCTKNSVYSRSCCSIALWAVSAIRVYPCSAATPDVVSIPVATVTNSTRRWPGFVSMPPKTRRGSRANMCFPVICILGTRNFGLAWSRRKNPSLAVCTVCTDSGSSCPLVALPRRGVHTWEIVWNSLSRGQKVFWFKNAKWLSKNIVQTRHARLQYLSQTSFKIIWRHNYMKWINNASLLDF